MIWATADLPGTGGVYKQHPNDFQVEEIPLYPCSGQGEHLYLWIEKEGISTHQLLGQLKTGLRLKAAQIGYAGLKDARARTRQMISVPARCAKQLSRLQLRRAEILHSQLHGNKLRLGHLAGNRFTIRLRDTVPNGAQRADAILQRLEQQGVPNRFGEQRYGILGNSARLGRLLLQQNYAEFCHELIGDPELIHDRDWRSAASAYRRGELETCLQRLPKKMPDEQGVVRALLAGKQPRQAVLGLPKNLLRLHLSAFQSLLFDQLLEQRLSNLQQLYAGDIACKHSNGACFRVEDAAREQARADSFEISPTAPLFGFKTMLATGIPGDREQAVLNSFDLTPASWKLGQGLAMPGERRPLRVPLLQSNCDAGNETTLELHFCLPKGSYATSVLSEITKQHRFSAGSIRLTGMAQSVKQKTSK